MNAEIELYFAAYLRDDFLPLEKVLGMLPEKYRLVLNTIRKSNRGNVCPKCEERVDLTDHHIFPQRHFGNGKNNNVILEICRPCHDKLEDRIPKDEKPKEFYVIQLYNWLTEPKQKIRQQPLLLPVHI